MRVARAVAEALAELGAGPVFGLLGSGNFEVSTALAGCGARFVTTRHECGAIMMANAHAQLAGGVGVCTVHQGPGFTNTATGLAEAAKSRIPLLVLAADSPAGAARSNFSMDQRAMAESVGALYEALGSPETAVAAARRAWRRARAERRPVVLGMPIDVQAAEAPEAPVEAEAPLPPPPAPDPDAVERTARRLLAAGRPVLIGGRGAVLAGAGPAIEALADATGALLATSAVGNGLFAGSAWNLGISGGFATPLAADLIPRSDLVVSFGATLNMWTTRHGRLVSPDAAVVQVDVDPGSAGTYLRGAEALVGDAALAAGALLEAIGSERRAGWRTPELEVEIARRRWRDEVYEDAGDGRCIDPRTLAIRLDDLVPDERILAVDSGHFMGWLPMYCRVPDAAGMVFTQGFQAVGLGLATAIGAALARPDRITVAALGDGGALMGLADLETAVRLALPLLVVVFNDAAYGAEVHHFQPAGHPLDLVRFPDTDFAGLARGAGAGGLTVRDAADLGALRPWLAAPAGPMLVDAKIVPTVVAHWLSDAFGH